MSIFLKSNVNMNYLIGDKHKVKTYGKRKCSKCKSPLSIYNPGNVCQMCKYKAVTRSLNKGEEVAVKGTVDPRWRYPITSRNDADTAGYRIIP